MNVMDNNCRIIKIILIHYYYTNIWYKNINKIKQNRFGNEYQLSKRQTNIGFWVFPDASVK